MSRRGEIIQIHIGQAGVQIANACWELYCLEHGIQADGIMCQPIMGDDSFHTFFDLSPTGCKVTPRLVMVDAEPTVIDEVRTGAYRHLFHPDTLITGNDDSGSNFARGLHFIADQILERTMTIIHRLAEQCHSLRGFLIFRAIGGGTGSGFGTALLERLSEEYKKHTKMEFIVFPSPSLSPVIVEPYNAVLAAHCCNDSTDVAFIVDNEALYAICANKLDVPAPTYTNLNRIIGQVVSSFTASQRFYGTANVSFEEFQTNLVPYPRIRYPLLAYAPLVPASKARYVHNTMEMLTASCFSPEGQMVHCDLSRGKYMACVLLYRGDVEANDVNRSINYVKSLRTTRFVDWSPSGFKVGVNAMPPCFVPGGDLAPSSQALCAIANSTVIQQAWCRVLCKFDRMYRRRAFIYHYVGEGMAEGELAEASENICQLIADYREVEKEGSTSSDNNNNNNSNATVSSRGTMREGQGAAAASRQTRSSQRR